MGQAFGKTPREVYETMGLNEFQAAYGSLVHIENAHFAQDVLSSMYGSRADAKAIDEILLKLRSSKSTDEAIDRGAMPLPPVEITTGTLEAEGFERVEVGDGK